MVGRPVDDRPASRAPTAVTARMPLHTAFGGENLELPEARAAAKCLGALGGAEVVDHLARAGPAAVPSLAKLAEDDAASPRARGVAAWLLIDALGAARRDPSLAVRHTMRRLVHRSSP